MSFYFFNNEKLSVYDKVSTLIYGAVTVVVTFGGRFFNSVEHQKSVTMAYAFLTPFLIYLLSYKSLRNSKMFILWIGIGVFHIFLYKGLITNQQLMFVRSHAAHGLQFTLLFVILFEILRIAHLWITGYELVSLGYYGARRDLWEDRKIKIPDIICFFIYTPIWILIQTLG